MPLVTVNFGSAALGKCTGFRAVIPNRPGDNDIPTMYLLHGLSDDNSCWSRFSRIEHYAEAHDMAVIMPEGDRSFYEDMAYGQKFYTHIVKEVVDLSRQLFKLSDKREKTFITGLSMGGYGAFKIAMRNPDMFAGACSMSGVMDIAHRIETREWDPDMRLIFGDDRMTSVRGSDADLFTLAEKMKECPNAPKLLQICGTEDFLWEDNLRFRDHAKSLGLDFTWEEHPGSHCWEFWDLHVRTALDVFAGMAYRSCK